MCVELIKVEPESLSLQPSSHSPPWPLWRFKRFLSPLRRKKKKISARPRCREMQKSWNAHAAKQSQLCVWICRSEEIYLGTFAYSLQFDSLQQANCRTGSIWMCLSTYWLSKIIFLFCFCSCFGVSHQLQGATEVKTHSHVSEVSWKSICTFVNNPLLFPFSVPFARQRRTFSIISTANELIF